MPSYNKVVLMGYLTRDPELRFTEGGSAVCDFGVATNKKYKKGDDWKEEVCFVDITAWNKQAENINEYLKKGSAVLIDGELRLQQWQKDGEKRNKLTVTANEVRFLDKKPDYT